MQSILNDLKSVLKPLWLIILLQLFVVFAFLKISQGIDVLYAVIEDFSTLFKFNRHHFFLDAKILPFISILFALAYWATVSEFCSRLILYLSDYSSVEMTIIQKHRRYYISKNVPKILFYFPITVLMVGFLFSFLIKVDNVEWTSQETYNLVALVFIEICLFSLLKILYNIRYGKWSIKYKKPIFGYVDIVRLVGLTGVYSSKETNGAISIRKYKPIFVIFLRIFSIAVISILLFAFAPVGLYEKIGSTAFVCMGFACWIVIFTIIEWVTKRGLFGIAIPFKTIIIVFILFMSYKNNDHPFRLVKSEIKTPQITFYDYTQKWISKHIQTQQNDTIYPIFIAAEGGALRTGCFSAMMLASIQDSFPKFKNNIFCFSSVSGGSLGVSFFNSLCQQNINNGAYKDTTRHFFEYDFLAPVTGKLVFGEPFNWSWIRNIRMCDRSIFLEKAWEASWRNNKLKDEDMFNIGFKTNFYNHKDMPTQFINSTEVEYGRRTIISNVKIDSSIFIDARDLFGLLKFNEDIKLSTAISLSARFPLISPAGAYGSRKNLSRHFVDGGYYENKGDLTLLEALKFVMNNFKSYKIKPIVLQLSFDEEHNEETQGISFLNETQEIIMAMYNTRIGRTRQANKELQSYVKAINGLYIEYSLNQSANKVPMNWTLSDNALQNICNECTKKLSDTSDKTIKSQKQMFEIIK